MPSYPSLVVASLDSINQNSCGELTHQCDYQEGITPPEYQDMPGQGDFTLVWLRQVTLTGGIVTWKLRIKYSGAGSCMGTHEFLRVPNLDDPTGTFHKLVSGTPTQSAGEASVWEP